MGGNESHNSLTLFSTGAKYNLKLNEGVKKQVLAA